MTYIFILAFCLSGVLLFYSAEMLYRRIHRLEASVQMLKDNKAETQVKEGGV